MKADSRKETDYILVFGNIGFVIIELILANNITIQYAGIRRITCYVHSCLVV